MVIASHYTTLGVSEVATSSEIRKAYYKMAQVYHPDKNPNGTEKFKEIANAYTVLSDQSLKEAYDNKAALEKKKKKRSKKPDIRKTQSQKPSTPPPPPNFMRSDYNIYTTVKITLKEAYMGVDSTRIIYNIKINCTVCNGKEDEKEALKNCPTCNGQGRIEIYLINSSKRSYVPCFDCDGSGHINYRLKCQVCQGNKSVLTEIYIPIPKGIQHEQFLKIDSYGNLTPDNMTKGDLFVKVLVEEESGFFKRQGDHLYASIDISLKDALMGTNHNKDFLKHLDGHSISINQCYNEMITPGMTFLKINEGMPIFGDMSGRKGDLHITFNVIFPKTLNFPKKKNAINVINVMFETEEERAIRKRTTSTIHTINHDMDTFDGNAVKQEKM